MFKILIAFLFAAAAAAQTVTVTGSVTDAAGGQPVGTVTVAWPNFNYGGTIVQSGQTTKRPTAGSVSFTLYPGTYTVTYRLTNGNVTTVKWIVPSSPSSTTIAAVQAAFLAPNTPTPIPIAQGGTGASSFTASKCVQVNSDGDGLEASSDACGTSSIAASVQSGTSYTVVSGDKGKALFFTNSGAVSVTVPAASAITGSVILVAKGAGGVSTSGGYSVSLILNDYVILVSDGTTWRNVNQVLRAGTGQQASTTGAVTSFNLDALLVAISGLASNGFVVRTSSSASAARTITGTANEICVTNGDGVSGDPTSAICATFDVSGKTSTKPMKSGTSLPATCGVGEMYFKTDATAGENLYGCTATNTWSQQAGGGGSGSTAETYCVPTIVSGNLQVSTPCKVLVNNVELTFGSNMTCDASSGTGTILFGVQGTTAYCWHNVTLTATNATALGSTTAFPVDACALASATVTSGTVSDPVNIRLGRACPVFTSSSTATASADPSSGALQVDLVLSGTSEEVAVSGGTVSLPSKVNLGGKTLEIPNGTTLPATCVVGDQFMDTDATSGQRHYLCESTNTWALQGGGGGSVSETLVTIQQDMCGKTDSLGQFQMIRVASYSGTDTPAVGSEVNGRSGCGTKMTTGTGGTSFHAYSMPATTSNWLTLQSGRAPKLWFKWTAVSDTSTQMVMRLQPADATGATNNANGVGFVVDSNTFSDQVIRFQVCKASACTNTSTGRTHTANRTYEGKIEMTGASAWTWTLREWDAEGSITTNTGNVTSVDPPLVAIGPYALVLTHAAPTTKTVIFHQFRAQYETN